MKFIDALKLVVKNADGWNECPTPDDDEAVRILREYIELLERTKVNTSG